MVNTFGKIIRFEDNGKNHPFVVYLALNKLNGHFYIGATEKGTKGRESIHKKHARHGEREQHFYRAMRKYGEDSFKFLTIKECSDYWDALESERQYISLFKPRYNMTDGGGGVKGLFHTKETKAKMSIAKKGKPGRKMTEAMRLHLSEKRKGVKIRFSESSREKCKLNAFLANEVRRRSVICLNDGIEYRSISEATKIYGLTTGQISSYCKGKHKSKRGLKFRYVKEK